MSQRQFSKVSPAVWRSGRFTGLEESSDQLLYLYYLTCEHQNSAGCFRLPDGYACSDLGWPPERYSRARDRLVAAELITFDSITAEIYVDRWFKHNAPMGEKHSLGTHRIIKRIESDAVRHKVEAEFTNADDLRTTKVVPLRPALCSPALENSPIVKGRR